LIAVDSSALMAVVLDEPEGTACYEILAGDQQMIMSAGTLQETLIVASRRNVGKAMISFMDRFDIVMVDVNRSLAEQAAAAYRQWGKGFHPAALNFGDCFAYAVAKSYDCPLLFVGNDFSQTDITPAI
jgi:ribonuclease VapC